ncbi:hypothetical protein DFH05DRAFT_1520440 [Lentinula detonsa]|uniref:Uncharacterized protein n=1 Tax=Lentinula detonsa TaxID=2804962 RepID=A0A9W8P8G8_9AGAR|nr:hypothetical protein DFH05DRAFT_1520440 [Lentinula detonsa]
MILLAQKTCSGCALFKIIDNPDDLAILQLSSVLDMDDLARKAVEPQRLGGDRQEMKKKFVDQSCTQYVDAFQSASLALQLIVRDLKLVSNCPSGSIILLPHRPDIPFQNGESGSHVFTVGSPLKYGGRTEVQDAM